MTHIDILELATERMITAFKEIYTEAGDAGHAIDKMSEPTEDDDRLVRQIEKIADEIIPELEILKQDIEKWRSEKTEA